MWPFQSNQERSVVAMKFDGSWWQKTTNRAWANRRWKDESFLVRTPRGFDCHQGRVEGSRLIFEDPGREVRTIEAADGVRIALVFGLRAAFMFKNYRVVVADDDKKLVEFAPMGGLKTIAGILPANGWEPAARGGLLGDAVDCFPRRSSRELGVGDPLQC